MMAKAAAKKVASTSSWCVLTGVDAGQAASSQVEELQEAGEGTSVGLIVWPSRSSLRHSRVLASARAASFP